MNIFFFKFKWKVLKQINPNLGGLSRGLFLPPYSNGTTSFKTIPSFEFTYISCICYIRLFSPISVLTKKMSRRKKSLYKIISKSIHVDTANIYLFKVSDVVLVFLLLTLNIFHTFSSASMVDFEKVKVNWEGIYILMIVLRYLFD